MPDNKAVPVTATRTKILSARERNQASVANNGGATAFLGDDAVTAANGWPLAVGGSVRVDMEGNEELHGVTASGTADLRIL